MNWGSVIGAGISAVGSFLGAQKQREVTSDVNAQQIAWQREAMQNRHQWEVEDLKKAGLNPILSANAGASTGGAGFHPQVPDYMQGYNAMAQNAITALKSIADIENTEANTKVADATVKRINQETYNLGTVGEQVRLALERDKKYSLGYEVGSRSGWISQLVQGVSSVADKFANFRRSLRDYAKEFR